LLKKVDKF
jgi:ribonuclease HI